MATLMTRRVGNWLYSRQPILKLWGGWLRTGKRLPTLIEAADLLAWPVHLCCPGKSRWATIVPVADCRYVQLIITCHWCQNFGCECRHVSVDPVTDLEGWPFQRQEIRALRLGFNENWLGIQNIFWLDSELLMCFVADLFYIHLILMLWLWLQR